LWNGYLSLETIITFDKRGAFAVKSHQHVAHIYGNSGGAFNEMHMVVGGVYEVDLINEEHSNMILCRSDKYATHINGNIGGVNEANIINEEH